jgi:hypothetical protein
MNGCELPCRSVLQVQEASSNRKKEQPTNQLFARGPATMQGSSVPFLGESGTPTSSSKPNNEEKQAQEATEDLDDFFASL